MSRRNKASLLAAAHAALLACTHAFAGISFNAAGSSLSIVHDPDRSTSTIAPKTVNVATVPGSGGMPSPPTFQLDKLFVSGSAESDGAASLGHVTNSSTASFVLAGGTGVTQSDPADQFPGASSLRLTMDLNWNVTSGGWGSPAEAYVSVTLGFTVGQGGGVQYIPRINFTDPDTGNAYAAQYNPGVIGFSTPGNYVQTFTYSAPFASLNLAAGRKVRVHGFLEFRSSNEDSPSVIRPINVEAGGSGPTFTWNTAGSGAWTDVQNWDLGKFPNAPSDKARFINFNEDQTTVTLDRNITIGELVVDSPLGYFFANTGDGRLTFSRGTVGGAPSPERAVIHVRNAFGNDPNLINLPMSLTRDLEVIVDGTAPPGATAPPPRMTLAGAITGVGGIWKMGDGDVALTRAGNAFQGGVRVLDGVLRANAVGTLSEGSVTVEGGQLDYNANGAADQTVQVISGVLNLGVIPNANDRFRIFAGGSVKGSSAELAALNAGVGGNLILEQGATIVHETFTSQNPAGIQNGTLIFGVGFDLTQNNFTMGTQSNTPWRGIGGDKGRRTFGRPDLNLSIVGAADLVAQPGGALIINSPLRAPIGTVPGRLTKRGLGTVVLNGVNTFIPTVTEINEGTLVVNGSLGGDVMVQGGATLAGDGQLPSGQVDLLPINKGLRSVLSPGDPLAANTIATLTMQRLSLEEALLRFEFRPGSHDFVNLTGVGSLSMQDVSLVEIVDLDGLQPGVFPLINYTTKSGNVPTNLRLGPLPTNDFVFKLVDDLANTLINLEVALADTPQWGVNGGGAWGTAGNWIGDVPDDVGDTASFLGKLLTVAAAPAVVTLGSSRTLGYLEFNNNVGGGGGSYTLVGSSTIALTMDNGGLPAIITVHSGSQAVNARMIYEDNTELRVATNATFNATAFLHDVRGGNRLDKMGAGRANLSDVRLGANSALRSLEGRMDVGHVSGSTTSGVYVAPAAVLIAESVRGAGLVVDGSMTIATSGNGDVHSNENTSDVQTLVLGQTGRLNLSNNGMAIRNISLATLRREIIEGRGTPAGGAAEGEWDGTTGITSNTASKRFQEDGQETRSVGYALNSGLLRPYTTFMGVAVEPTDMLVRYTRTGDVTLDGMVDDDDVSVVGGFYNPNYNPFGILGPRHWFQGDLNFNGIVEDDDVTVLGGYYNPNLAPLADEGVGISVVPEAGSGVLLCVTAALTLGRRRHHRAAAG